MIWGYHYFRKHPYSSMPSSFHLLYFFASHACPNFWTCDAHQNGSNRTHLPCHSCPCWNGCMADRHNCGCPLLPKLDGASLTGCCTSCWSGVGTSTGISPTVSSSSAWGLTWNLKSPTMSSSSAWGLTWNLKSWDFCWSSATYTAAGSSTLSVPKDGQLRERGNEGSEDSAMKVLRYTNVTMAPETKGVCHILFDCAYPCSQKCWKSFQDS